MKLAAVNLYEELEQAFNSELSETHKSVSDLLRDILKEHYEIKKNPIAYLVNQPSFQKLLGLAVQTNLNIEAAKAKLETAKQLAELKEKHRKIAAKERALMNQPKVDYAGCEGGAVDRPDYDQPLDGFAMGDR